MAIPSLTPLPPAPTPSDSPAVFASKSGAFVTAEVQMVNELNPVIDTLNVSIPTAISAAASAQSSADKAEAAAAVAGNPNALGLIYGIALCF